MVHEMKVLEINMTTCENVRMKEINMAFTNVLILPLQFF